MEAERRELDEWPKGARVHCGDRTVRDGCVFSPSTVTAISARWNECPLERVRYSYSREEERWTKVLAVLRESRVLVKLELVNLTKAAATTLFGRGVKYNWPSLKVLILEGNLGLTGMKTICSAVKTSSTGLDKLQLEGTKLGVKNVNYLVDMLNHTRISDLCLYSGAEPPRGFDVDDSYFKEGELENLLTAENARYLVRLRIGGKILSARNYEFISRFLQRDNTLLKGLDIPVNLNSEAKLLIDSIPQSKLEDIELHGFSSNRDVRDAIFDLVCDTSSVGALCNSNHRLGNIGKQPRRFESAEDRSANEKLQQALEINRQVQHGAPVSYAIRRKMRYVYLENPEFNVTPFNDMDVALMPHALELVARAESPVDRAAWNRRAGLPRNSVCSDKLDGLYRLLKNCHVSELFDFPSTETQLRQQLHQKDRIIPQLEVANMGLKADLQRLEGANEDLKAQVERMRRVIDGLAAEKEERGRADPSRPNKRAKMSDIESRLAAVEADLASLKKSRS